MVKDMNAQLPLYKYVDDTTLSEICVRNRPSSVLQDSANNILTWCDANKMIINESKTKEMIINFSKSDVNVPDLVINGQKIERVTGTKLLGVTITNDLSWSEHVDIITGKASQRLFFLRLLRRANVNMDQMIQIYCSLIRPTVEYACQVWHGNLGKGQSDLIESIQERALKIIMPDASYDLAREIASLPTLADRRKQLCKKMFQEIQNTSHKLHHLLPAVKTNSLRSGQKYPLPKCKTDRGKNCGMTYLS